MTLALTVALLLSAGSLGWSLAYIPITLEYGLGTAMLTCGIIGVVLSLAAFIGVLIVFNKWCKI